jgi:hypothetical protein
MADTWDDERIARLVRDGGPEGLACYGLWWRVLEIVARQVGPKSQKCTVKYDVTRWSLLLSLRGSHVRNWLVRLSLTGLVTTLVTENSGTTDIEVTIPNLLKYRDEYTKKSGHSPVSVPTRTDTDTEQNIYSEAFQKEELAKQRLKDLGWVGIRKTPETAVALILDLTEEDFPRSDDLESAFMIYCRLNWFENFWGLYWRHDDKRSARTAYFAAVKNMEMMDIVDAAVCAQSAAMLARAKTYQPLAATWLNKERWGDELEISQEAGG